MLNTSHKRILTECANAEFKEVGIGNPYLAREYSQIDILKYCCFHKIHGHNTNDYIQLKVVIETLIKKGRLFEYTKDGKRCTEESPKEWEVSHEDN